MKRTVLFAFYLLLISIIVSCESKKKEFSLLGKWELKEMLTGDWDGKLHPIAIEKEKIFIFKDNNEVINESRIKGEYHINGNKLHLHFSSYHEYYTFDYDKNNIEKLKLVPTDSLYRNGCDEGCFDVYVKD